MAFLSCSFVACGNQDLQNNLNAAIANDSYQDIESTIKAGAQINFEQASKSPLLKAMLMRKRKAVKALLEFGANPNILYMEKPLIYWALKNCETEIALYLVKAGADFSGTFDGEQDAFTYVAINLHGSIDLLSAMVQRGYDIKSNFTNQNLKNNAWYLSLIHNKRDICYFLNIVKDNPYQPLAQANVHQKFVYENGCIWTPLLIATEQYISGNQPSDAYNMIALLLHAGADVNQSSNISKGVIESPISYVFKKNNPYLLDLFLQKKPDLVAAFKIFINNGGDKECALKTPFRGESTPLILAISYNDIDAVKLLLKEGVSVNQGADPYPHPQGAGEIQTYLQNRKLYGDPLEKLRGTHTPLFFALHDNKNEISEILLEHGAFV